MTGGAPGSSSLTVNVRPRRGGICNTSKMLPMLRMPARRVGSPWPVRLALVQRYAAMALKVVLARRQSSKLPGDTAPRAYWPFSALCQSV